MSALTAATTTTSQPIRITRRRTICSICLASNGSDLMHANGARLRLAIRQLHRVLGRMAWIAQRLGDGIRKKGDEALCLVYREGGGEPVINYEHHGVFVLARKVGRGVVERATRSRRPPWAPTALPPLRRVAKEQSPEIGFDA